MKRIHVLLPDVTVARQVVNQLLLAHVDWHHIHILARPDIGLEELPEASIAQRSDLLAALARGTAAGGITGLLAGMLAMTFPPAGLAIAGGALLALTAGGAGFGAWMAAMIGVDVPNSQLKRFEQAITAGNLLMLVDVPRDRQTPIEAVIRDGFPAAEFTVSRPTSGVEVA